MSRVAKLSMVAAAVAAAAVTITACGTKGVSVAQTSPYHQGAVLFAQRCGGCHTLAAAGTQGTSLNKNDRERVDGPNLNTRKETPANVLYAIQNGGFSGAIMPQNIVVGPQAREVAAFVARYAGKQAKSPKSPPQPAAATTTPGN